MRLFFYIPLAYCLLMLAACSQPKKEQLELEAEPQLEVSEQPVAQDGKEVAKAAFKKQYPEAEDVEWGKDDNDYYEASFKLAGKKYRADYSQQGEWIETESSIKFGDLPEAVKKTIRERYNKDDITEIEKVEHASRGLFYDVEFKRGGKNKDVEIRENGEVIKE